MMDVPDKPGSTSWSQSPREASSTRRGTVANLVIAWFTLDAFLCLFPPLYRWADGLTQPILGVPVALFYFLAVSACTVASIVFAFLGERAGAEVTA